MATSKEKIVRFRALKTLSLRPTDEWPAEFTDVNRHPDTPANVLTPGEEWHFTRSEVDITRLVQAGIIHVLPEPSPTPVDGEEN